MIQIPCNCNFLFVKYIQIKCEYKWEYGSQKTARRAVFDLFDQFIAEVKIGKFKLNLKQ